MRVVQVRKIGMVIPSRMVVHGHKVHLLGKCLDDPQHLGNFQKDLSTKACESDHVLLF